MMLLINHSHVDIVKSTSSMLFLVAEHLLLWMLEGHASVIIIVVLMARLASIISSMHGYVLAPLLKVLSMLDLVVHPLIHIILAGAVTT